MPFAERVMEVAECVGHFGLAFGEVGAQVFEDLCFGAAGIE